MRPSVSKNSVVRLVSTGLCFGLVFLAFSFSVAQEPKDALFTDEQQNHWSYQQVKKPKLPQVINNTWGRNVIDRYVLAKLESNKLTPAAEADRRTFIRRATYDLHGLPPAIEEVAAFVNDSSPDAYEQLIDRLLASPRYGERWGRHWLDLARYAESDGYKSDVFREGAWRYRDYVVRAMNDDKPYDRFIAEQLAGDELWPQHEDAVVATGFLRHWPYEDNGRDLDRQWAAILNDVTDVTGQVFLGMTVRCARCHDHKFDAILQKDYFRLQAFFNAMSPRNDLPIGSDESLEEYYAKLEQWEKVTNELRQEKLSIQSPYYQKEQRSKAGMFPPHIQKMVDLEPEKRTPYQQQLVMLAGKMLTVEPKKMAGRMPDKDRNRWRELNREIAKFVSLRPEKLDAARGVRDIGPEAPPTKIPLDDEAGNIKPGFLSVIDPSDAPITPISDNPQTTGRRSALARWIANPKNPLTARVIVNRLWQHHFSEGIVRTPGDFGVMGEEPTHPQLLDYLASQLIENDWSLKSIHRLMMTSSTYRQSSLADPQTAGRLTDPDNRLLWRMNPKRVEAEILRDGMLATSGSLNHEMYGKSVFPKLPAGLTTRYAWKPTPDPAAQNRRSIYLVVKRNTHLPLLKTFDVPDNHDTCMRRDKTTTPTQALILLNDRWPLEQARQFASRLLSEVGTDTEKLIDHAYSIVFSRHATKEELAAGNEFISEQAEYIKQRFSENQPIALPTTGRHGLDPATAAAVVDYCHALWNTNEFMYID